MKSRFLLLGACALLLGGAGRAHAQRTANQDHLHAYKTTPVWSDDFNGTAVNPDNWAFETTDVLGVQNNEYQYYQEGGANTSVAGGVLTITARRESVYSSALGRSFDYTSARMKTKGLQDIRFGRVEARIEMPQGDGLWPGFWMLGSNIDETIDTKWPKCGEIDIVERINQGNQANATEHWHSDASIADPAIKWENGTPGHKFYPTSMDMPSTGYHIYAMEWDQNSIWTWVDGVKYHEFNIKDGINSTEEFQKRFFVLLNLAVGGDMPFGWWTGVTLVKAQLPATMNVDYVKFFERADAPVVSAQGIQLEAENADYADMHMHIGKSMKVEACAEGGEDMGYINAGNFLKFNVNFPGAGTYRLDYRVAGTGGTISADLNGGAVPLGNTTIPGTGGWQTWQTVSKTFTVATAGTYDLGIFAQTAGYNLNWIRLTAVSVSNPPPPPPPTPPTTAGRQLEAESANVTQGMTAEACTDAGGGLDMAYIQPKGFLTYNSINFPTSGTYLIEYRVASGGTGGSISCDLNGGAIPLGVTTVPGTGGWQTWQTVTNTATIAAGTYNFGVFAQTGGYNLNWIRITKQGAARPAVATAVNVSAARARPLQLYPNPVTTSFVVDGLREAGELTLRDYLGRTCLHKQVEANERVDMSTLPAGIYVLTVRTAEGQLVQKLVKQ